MSELDQIKSDYKKYVLHTYGSYPVAFERGEGAYLYDTEGKRYLDFVAGLATCNLGHSNPAITATIKEQAENLLHTTNLYLIPNQAKVARKIVESSFAGRCFFCNSGAEANEAAIKLARKYSALNYSSERYEIITMKRSFHGRTMATLTATGQPKYHRYFDPFLAGFKYVEYNDITALERAVSEQTCAIMMEPIQGEGGVNIPADNYLNQVRALCDRQHLLLILDEVQTGFGRTGRNFAYQHSDIVPDIMSLAKGMGNGIPVGAIVAGGVAAEVFAPGDHASTFGGNPFSMAVVSTVLEQVTAPGFCDNVASLGAYLQAKLRSLQAQHPCIREVRGRGLMIAAELDCPGGPIVSRALERGLLINCIGESTLRFVPPLIITEADIDQMLGLLGEVLNDC